jgi:hypothetical protein
MIIGFPLKRVLPSAVSAKTDVDKNVQHLKGNVSCLLTEPYSMSEHALFQFGLVGTRICPTWVSLRPDLRYELART